MATKHKPVFGSFTGRRLLGGSLCFLAVLYICGYLAHDVSLILGVIGVCAAPLLFLLLRRHPFRVFAVLLTVCASLGAFVCYIDGIPVKKVQAYIGQQVLVSARITDIHYAADHITLGQAELYSINGENIRVPIKISLTGDGFALGDVIQGYGLCDAIQNTSADFDAVGYARSQGIAVSFTPESAEIVENKPSLRVFAAGLQGKMETLLRERVGGESGEFLCALLLGDRSGLSEGVVYNMHRLGIYHMIALSGLHMTILIGGLAILLQYTLLPYRLRILLLSLVGGGYMLLAGLPASMLRAGFMLFLSGTAFYLKRVRNSVDMLAFAVALICLLSPCAVYDVGLWLSASATLGILLFVGRMQKRKLTDPKPCAKQKVADYLFFSFGLTVSASVMTMPLTVLQFGTFSLISPLANLLFAPLIQLFLYLGVAVLLFGFVPFVSSAACHLGNLVIVMSDALADMPHILLETGRWWIAMPLLTGCFAVIGYYICCPKKRFRIRVPIALLCATALLVGSVVGIETLVHIGRTDIRYAYQGKAAEGLYIRQNDFTAVVDLSGDGADSLSYGQAWLKTQGRLETNVFVLGEYRMAAVPDVMVCLEASTVREIYLPKPLGAEDAYCAEQIEASANENGVDVVYYGQGDFLSLGNTEVRICYKQKTKEDERCCTVLSVVCGEERLLYISANAYQSAAAKAVILQQLSNCDTVIFGGRGSGGERLPVNLADLQDKKLIYANEQTLPSMPFDADEMPFVHTNIYDIAVKR